METLQLLGTALGLASLAGINLYLTVFVTGLAIEQGWIVLHPQYHQLAILSDPVILWVSGILFVLEFFADKVPWVDTLWDAVHTIIRPVGGAMLSITVLGDANPVYDVIVGLLGGGMALTTHGAKAGTRLLVNASPEPFSNIGLSLAEDATVFGGLALVYKYPIVALVVSVASVALLIWLAPRAFRATRTMLWFVWRRVQHALGANPVPSASIPLPPDVEIALFRDRGDEVAVQWAAPCVTGRGEHLKGNIFGWLLLTDGDKGGLDFVRNTENRPKLAQMPIHGWKALHRTGWMCDRVVIYDVRDARKQVFQFDRSRRDLAADLARELNRRAAIRKPEATTTA